jgi:hypothetical protein
MRHGTDLRWVRRCGDRYGLGWSGLRLRSREEERVDELLAYQSQRQTCLLRNVLTVAPLGKIEMGDQ